MLIVLMAIVIGAIMARSPITGGLARADKASVDKQAAKRELPLPDDLRPVITDRLVRREKTLQAWSAAGIILGSLSIALVPLFYGWDTGDTFWVPLILGGFGIGSILGRLRLVRRGVPSLPGRSQVARPVRPTVTDYVTTSEVICFFLVPVSIVLNVAGMWIFLGLLPYIPGEFNGRYGLVTAVNIVLLLLWALMPSAARKFVATPQYAGNDLELAWDDAERTSILRALGDGAVGMTAISAVFTQGVVGELILHPHVRSGAEDLTNMLAAGAFFVGLNCAALVIAPLLPGRLKRTPWRRLWPNGVSWQPALRAPRVRVPARGRGV
ncbi:hypothetical protein [Brevibacterium ravenspurgense]|uniref:hypothetical protein n=1 Tax=Brevibacterium ravenspurgense TaxID=479117 RepID=UPI000780EC21|nr:hypothetical protein [Brevibacterium ravenspurgense]